MNTLSRCKPLLGTYVEISLAAEKSDDQLIKMSEAGFEVIAKIEQAMSFHRKDSELTKINNEAHLKSCAITDDLYAVLHYSLMLSADCDGVFDISVGDALMDAELLPRIHTGSSKAIRGCWRDIELNDKTISFNKPLLIDLGGVAKGYAVDKVFSLFDEAVEVVVNAGGDLRMSHWQGKTVGVRHPASPKQLIELPMLNKAVATSGAYYTNSGKAAIIAPDTQQPLSFQHSVSVFAESCIVADSLTKVAMLAFQPTSILAQYGAEIVIINQRGQLGSI